MKRKRYSMIAILALGLLAFAGAMSIANNSEYVQSSAEPISAQADFALSYTAHDAIWIIGNDELVAQATAESWPGDGSAQSPYLITGYYFDQFTQPLRMWHVDLYWKFIGNEVDGNSTVQCGFWVVNCTNGAIVENQIHRRHSSMYLEDLDNFNISYNHIYDNRWCGIEILGYCNNTLIQHNQIHDNLGSGIRITQPKNTEIVGNTIANCESSGIQFMGLSFDTTIFQNNITGVIGPGIQMGTSMGLTIEGNHISNASTEGLYIINAQSASIEGNTISQNGGNGISLASCEFVVISDNTISNNIDNGIKDASCENSSIFRNTLESNGLYGLLLGDTSSFAEVKWNAFIDNGNNPQVCDDGTENQIHLNHYNDWISPDANSDRIVDNAYTLDGTALNKDCSPLTAPDATPVVTTTTSEGTLPQLPGEIAVVAAGGIAIAIIGMLFLKKRT